MHGNWWLDSGVDGEDDGDDADDGDSDVDGDAAHPLFCPLAAMSSSLS